MCETETPRPSLPATRRALLIGKIVSAYHGSADKAAEWCSLIERDPEVKAAFRNKVRVVTCVAIKSHDLLIRLSKNLQKL